MALSDLPATSQKDPRVTATLPPPMQLSREDLATYYHRLGDIEAFYFYLCRIDEYSSKRREWRFLNRKIHQLTQETTDFANHLRPINALCADQLTDQLDTARRLLWLDDDSDPATNDYLAEEGTEINSYNENNWHKDPQFWEDQTGLHLNELALLLCDEVGLSLPHSTISALEYVNEQRQFVLDDWVEIAAEKTNVQFAGRMRYWHREGIKATNDLIALLNNPPSTFQLFKLVMEFALYRNERCENVALVYQRVLQPKSFYARPYPYRKYDC